MAHPVANRTISAWYAGGLVLLVGALLVGLLDGLWDVGSFLLVFAAIGLVTATSLWHAGRRLKRRD